MPTSQKQFFWIIAVIVIVVTTIPYIVGYVTRPEGSVYTGIHSLTPGDTATYYAFMEQSQQGHALFTNLYTTESQPRILLSPLWLVLGNIGSFLNVSHSFMYHVARIALIPFFLFVVFRLVNFIVRNEKTERVIMLIIAFGSGLGAFFTPFIFTRADIYNTPTDVWVPESVPFLSMYHSPLLLLSWTFMLLALFFILRSFEERSLRLTFFAASSAIVLFLLHPFYVPTLWVIPAVWVLASFFFQRPHFWMNVKRYGLFVLLSGIPLLYFYWLDRTSEVLHIWSASNLLPSPNPVMYIIGFGFLLPFAIVSSYRTFSQNRMSYTTLWFIAGAVLLYIPISFQRRLIEGLFIPIAILAGVALVAFFEKIKKKSELASIAFVIFFVVFLPMTNISELVQDVAYYVEEPRYPFYIPKDDFQAMQWIRGNTEEDASVLSAAFYSGNLIPAYTGRYVFVGHGPQTLYLDEKRELVSQFFSQKYSDVDRIAFLKEWGLDYIFWGYSEQLLGPYDPREASFLDPVFTSGETVVFKVRDL